MLWVWACAASASIPSRMNISLTDCAKYGAKINVKHNVKNGWLAQSKNIQPQTRFLVEISFILTVSCNKKHLGK